MKLFLISLKYSPGLLKELALIGNQLKRYGYEINYLLDSKYSHIIQKSIPNSKFVNHNVTNRVSFFIEFVKHLLCQSDSIKILQTEIPDAIFFYNVSLFDLKIIIWIKRINLKCKLILYLHEPFKPSKRVYGLHRGILIYIRELLQDIVIGKMDEIVLPSKLAEELFKRRYGLPKGNIHQVRLLVEDIHFPNKQAHERKYYSYVGNINKATGFDKFLKLVDFSTQNNEEFLFALITSSKIESQYRYLLQNPSIRIINKRVILDREINEIVQQSYAVFRLDEEITQSGVIPVCFMNSTPVICSNIKGFSQDINHLENGFLVPKNCDYSKIVEAMQFIMDNFKALSTNAYATYLEKWSEENFSRYYSWLI